MSLFKELQPKPAWSTRPRSTAFVAFLAEQLGPTAEKLHPAVPALTRDGIIWAVRVAMRNHLRNHLGSRLEARGHARTGTAVTCPKDLEVQALPFGTYPPSN